MYAVALLSSTLLASIPRGPSRGVQRLLVVDLVGVGGYGLRAGSSLTSIPRGSNGGVWRLIGVSLADVGGCGLRAVCLLLSRVGLMAEYGAW